MGREDDIRFVTDIIEQEVGFFNGWKVSDEAERKVCEIAATRIVDYLRSKYGSDNALMFPSDLTI